MTSVWNRVSWVSALLAAALPAGVATAAESERVVEEIVVTAQKREQSVQDVPMSVQVLTGEDLEASGMADIGDLVKQIPGATHVSRLSPGFETISIRGISSGTTGDATVGYYIDDAAFGVPNLQLTPPSRLYDLQRVEVLRGPYSTLWGQGAMGGTIRLITADPDPNTFAAKTQVEGSDTKDGEPGYAVDAMVNIPLMEDRVGLRLTGGREHTAGYAESPDFPNRDDINDIDARNARAKLLITPNEDVAIKLSAWTIKNEMGFWNVMNYPVDPPIISGTGGVDGYSDTNLDIYSAIVEWDVGPGTILSSSAYFDHELDFLEGYVFGLLRYDGNFKTDAFTQELRFVSELEGPFQFLAGVYYNDVTIASDIDLTFAGGPFINSTSDIKSETWAVFGEATYELFNGRVVALAGLRYSEDDRSALGFNRITNMRGAPRGDVWDTTNPRFNITFHANDDVMLYINAAKGFRSGSFQTQAQVTAAQLDGINTGTAIEPDSVWSYEFGTKGVFANGALIVDAAIYYMDWQDIQLQFNTTSAVIALANGGEAHSAGIDLGFVWNTPLDGLSLQFTGNINDAEFDNVEPAIAAGVAAVDDGKRIPSVPKKTLAAAVDYTWPIAAWNMDGNFNLGYVYRDDQIDAASALVSDEIKEVALRVGVSRDGWRVTLFGDNLLDERYAFVRTSSGAQSNMPRRIGVRLDYAFE
jgi:outer membrane receptor protein involved in Fe transport